MYLTNKDWQWRNSETISFERILLKSNLQNVTERREIRNQFHDIT